MSKKSLYRLRVASFARQCESCFYYALPMWLGDPLPFAQRHALSLRQAKLPQCTAEHLVARQDGVSDAPDNIFAACLYESPASSVAYLHLSGLMPRQTATNDSNPHPQVKLTAL